MLKKKHQKIQKKIVKCSPLMYVLYKTNYILEIHGSRAPK